MKKRLVCIIICCFCLAFCYSQKGDSLNGKGQAVTKIHFILFDSVMVVINDPTRLRINSLEQLGIYLDHSSIPFENTDAIIATSQMTDMRYYDPLKNFLQRYKFHSVISHSIILQAPGPAK
jgi:hypothetical protein